MEKHRTRKQSKKSAQNSKDCKISSRFSFHTDKFHWISSVELYNWQIPPAVQESIPCHM
jgi:hypothetical protein